MALFVGKAVNKVDRKGRVSVPARFRSALAGQTFHGVAVFPSTDGSKSLTCCGEDVIDELSRRFRSANPFAPTYTEARMAFFSAVEKLPFDGDGRVLLPADLLAHAEITTRAAFVGAGHEFRIWEPDAYEAAARAMKKKSLEALATLELPPLPGGER